MRRNIFICTIILIALVSQACAGVQSFGNFRVNVPRGWTGELQSSTLVVKSSKYNASVAAAVAAMGDADFSEIAERLYTQMNGDNLEKDSDGDYTFMFTNLAGGESFAIVSDTGEGYYLVLSVTGYDIAEVQDDLEKIIDSLDWED